MKSSDLKKPSILVVDDEPDNLDLLYRTFHREFKVLRAENGPAALEMLAAKGEVAVIISDQRMPLMSGTEFLSLTATQYPDTIRIILTGYTDVVDLVEAINSGKVFKYVTKPWNEEELKTVVRQAVDTHNVLKTRTQELRRTLRQESLLNAVATAIRQAPSYQTLLQTLVDTVGQMFEVDCCLLRPQDQPQDQPQDIQDMFVYQSAQLAAPIPLALLQQTLWDSSELQVLHDVRTDLPESAPSGSKLQAYQAAQIASSLIVPLVYKQESMAVLALQQRLPRQWQDDEIALIKMVADQAAPTLSQALAYEQARALAKREALVNTITAAIRSSLDPEEIFAAITQQLGQALHVDGCALSLWTAEDEFVRCVGLHDATQPHRESPELPQSVAPIEGNPVLQQLLTTQAPVVVNDLSQHDAINSDLPLRSAARALLVVPLLYDGRIIGSISLRQVHQPRHWAKPDVELAQAVAAQAAIAVHQSQLYETTRQQAEQLRVLDRQKTEFFQNVSHEFRTPLTLTIGPLESSVAQQEGLSFDQSVIALRNSRRLLRLVNQLLDLQRLDAGQMQASFRPCDLYDFVEQIIQSFRPYCEKKQLSLTARLTACESIYLDAEKFDKVLYNLLSNAIKFTEAGGQIEVALEAEAEHCLIQVRDSGIGIREDQLPYLFHRFRQADGSASRSYEGSGLGLALVKELVELHRGEVWVESTYGSGTCVSIRLPWGKAHLPAQQILDLLVEPEQSRAVVELADVETELQTLLQPAGRASGALPLPPALTPAAAAALPAKLLVVDDNADMRGYVTSVLQRAGYQIWTARNGAEGYEVAKAQLPDLIVTDLMMPLVSGLELIQMIRQDAALQGTPTVLLTAKADVDTRIEGAETGADAYLSKPFNDRELLAEVRNLLALKANERRVAELNTYLTQSVLQRFLPPSLVQKAAQGDLILDLRPEPRLITVLFSDIVGFTQLSNTLRSRRVAELLNEYLSEMTRAIFDNGGTVDKFVGDAIVALFGAPEDLTPNEQVRRAIAAARQMYCALATLNQRWQAQGVDPIQFRCGIHQGTAVVGMFGSAERSDYTAIGPTVNIAARLQEAADPNAILVSAAVADYLDESTITKFSPLKLKGVDETVLTFKVEPKAEPERSQIQPCLS